MRSPFEMVMLLCFAISWPLSIYRSWKSRTAKGKSIPMLIALLIGYISGILHKFIYSMDWIVGLYMLNFLMIFVDLALTLRNKRLDAQALEQKREELYAKKKVNCKMKLNT